MGRFKRKKLTPGELREKMRKIGGEPYKKYMEIKYAKEEQRKKKGEAWRLKHPNRAVEAIEQMQYIIALERCILILPQKPPEKWDEKSLKKVNRKAKLIRKRLEMFVCPD